jgi:Putative zinc-finger
MNSETCSSIQDRLPEFARNALDAGETIVVARHLETCVDCRGELELVRVLGASVAVPTGLEDRVVIAVRSRPAWRSAGVRQYAVAASFVMALVTASLIWRSGDRPTGSHDGADATSVVSLEWRDTRNPLLPETAGLQALSEEELLKLLQELES